MGAINMNVKNVLDNVNAKIEEMDRFPYLKHAGYHTREVCNQLGIFDWWTERLSLSQLKAMRTFLNQAVKMGFGGYVCFKVGAKYCASGMWAYKNESNDGYSPDGDFLYRSFYSSGNYWDAQIGGKFVTEDTGSDWNEFNTVAKLKKAMAA